MTVARDFSNRYYIRLSQVRERFFLRLGSDISDMRRDLAQSATVADDVASEALERLHHKLHEITGSAGMLGLNNIHSSGRQTLNLVEHAVDDGRPLDEGEGKAVDAFLQELSSHAQTPKAG